MIDYHRIKAICCDTVGTLYSDDGTISEENRRWIEKVKEEKGVLFLEVQPEDKESVVLDIARQLSVSVTDICAIGNDEDDLPMFKAGVRVAMAGSPLKLLMRADFITASNNADGIARIIKRLFYDIEDDEVINRFVR